MERIKFASLVGAETNWIRWGRPMLFCAALFFADLSFLFFRPLANYFTAPEARQYAWLASPLFWIETFLIELFLVLMLLVVFRWIRNDLLAVLTATILNIPIRLSVILFSDFISNLMYPNNSPFENPWLRMTLYAFLDTFTLVGGIILALLVIRQVWLALLIGSFFNLIVLQIFNLILSCVNK